MFDRYTKRLQKNRAAVAPDVATYDYIRDEVVYCAYVCIDLLSVRKGEVVALQEVALPVGWCR